VREKMLRELKHDHEHGHEHKPGEAGHHHDHGEHDPHLWLGIPEAVAMVEVIRDQLATIDKDHESEYKKNAAEYIESLTKLKADGLKKLDGKKVRRIVS